MIVERGSGPVPPEARAGARTGPGARAEAGRPGPARRGPAGPVWQEPVLPRPRGPLSRAVVEALRAGPPAGEPVPVPAGAVASADPYGEDLQLALHTCFELHYRGFAGVDPDWEWDPGLLALRGAMEAAFLAALRADTGTGAVTGAGGADVAGVLEELLVEPVGAAGVTHHLRDAGRWWQLREHAALRSVYHLKEADPHAWVIPRLRGAAKAALVAVEYDEFGGGRPQMLHSALFAGLLEDLGVDASYGAHVDAAPAVMLATVNMMSLFGLRRSLRGALVGHFAAAEITTAPAARRMAQALERAGAGPRAVLFYTEHIEADAVHEQVLRRDVIGGLLAGEPGLAGDVVLGVRATVLLEDRLEAHVLGCWGADPARSALRRPLEDGPAGGPGGDSHDGPAGGPGGDSHDGPAGGLAGAPAGVPVRAAHTA
ncbi:iron-containing redox enzyme family protein [Actinomadura graeca]|uniref:Iron-containing redox enzyme family protein n=1 Tax=Actinomadura graeca TaxID=2750812 RepID=A0ABX8QQX2_9ACTN|nr:iron-containing redox enzyme family protein [Actinomadura graeca]QXJ19797.1 iron-containing redox enzyme family protein [Actinomadura graeca]